MGKELSARGLLPALIYAALSTSVVSSLGMLLVPTISQEFNVPVGTGQWMLTVNLLVGAISTPVMGRLSDGPHKKLLLLVSLAVVLVGSIAAALTSNFFIFLLGRGLQGLTYGIVPITIALARRYLPARNSAAGISSLSVTVATGSGIGYPLTGLIAGLLDYRFAFWFAAAFAISAILVVLRAIPAGPDLGAPRLKFDLTGAVLLGLGLGALLIAISEGANWGWLSAPTTGLFGAAAVLITSWVLVELQVSHPLINLRVLQNGAVLLANATAVGLGMTMYMGLSIGSLIAQAPADTGYGISLPVLWAGFVMFPLSVGSFSANRLVRLLSTRIGIATLLPIGAGVVLVSTMILFFAHDELWEILVGVFFFGVGIGTTYAAMPALIARSVAAEELGSSVSFNQVLRTVGGSFGSAISGAVLAIHIGEGGLPSSQGIETSLAVSLAVGAAVTLGLVCNHLRVRSAPTKIVG